MPRPQMDGLGFYPKDVGFYNDRRIKVLISKFGCDGPTLYDYIMSAAYGDKGYYLEWDDDLPYIIAADLNMSHEKIGLILDHLLNRSMLLDGTLFNRVKVLTSRGIQKQYQDAVVSRGAKRGIVVDENLWLLSPEETKGYIKFANNEDKSEKNPGFSEKNPDKSWKNTTKENKRKEKKIKESKKEENKTKEKKIKSFIDGDTESFDLFWAAYPNKTGKQAALTSWKKIKPSAALLKKMLDTLTLAKQSEQWHRENGRYIPNPATWLNQGRWDDEYQTDGRKRVNLVSMAVNEIMGEVDL